MSGVLTSGVVLAGGASRRMGRDKALVTLDGERLVDRSVRLLQEVCDDVVVASGRRTIKDLRVPQVPDQRGGTGPLSGLASGLVNADHELACVLAVDLPYADPALLAVLAARWQGEAVLVPSVGNRAQPLHAVWATSGAVSLAVLVGDGVRSVMHAVELMGGLVLDDAETLALAGHDRWAHNVNTPADL